MSHFLTNLASRAVSSVPAVRPLVRSSYEPPAETELTWPATPPVTRKLDFQLPPVIPPRRNSEPARVPEIAEIQDTPHSIPSPICPIHETPPSAATTPAAAAPSSAARVTLEKLTEPIRPPIAATPPFKTASPEPRQFVQTVIQPMLVKDVVFAKTSTPVVMESNVVPPAATPATVQPPVTTPRPKAYPVPQVSLSRTPTRAAAPTYSPPEPTVTITIGRVEIRAAAPAARESEPPPKVTGPPLSLETYLRRSASRSA